MLRDEIERAARQVSTDTFSVTVGEVSNMYADGDVTINPEFQRLFRWDIARKSRLMESILVRIPLPPIFVFETQNSKWEVIDGLQRLSTILEFMGILESPDGGLSPTKPLIGTQYLPSLNGAFWSKELMDRQIQRDLMRQKSGDPTYFDNTSHYHVIDQDLQRAIKRSKIGVQLLEKKSDPSSKYDLFQRLNSGGMVANDQELRNSSLVMVNAKFYRRLKDLAESDTYSKLIPLGRTSIEKSNHMDNLCKVLAFTFRDYTEGVDIEDYVTNKIISIATDTANIDNYFAQTEATINLLLDALDTKALKPFNGVEFIGRIGRTAQEIIFAGVLWNYDRIIKLDDAPKFVREKIIEFWNGPDSKRFSAAGISGTDRVRFTIPFGREHFNP